MVNVVNAYISIYLYVCVCVCVCKLNMDIRAEKTNSKIILEGI